MTLRPHILGIIPARYASTRFPGKSLALIAGKSMIQRTFESASQCALIDTLVVATDDSRIYTHVEDFGGKAVYTSLDCPTGTDRLVDALQNDPHLLQAEFVINIQGDIPCLDPVLIDNLIQALLQAPDAVMSTAISRITDPEEVKRPSIVKCVIDKNQYALYFSRALIPRGHDGEMHPTLPYYKHIGLYCFRREFLLQYSRLPPTPLQLAEDLEQLKVLEHGFRIKTAIVKDYPIGVDLPEDIHKVEQWLCKQNISSLPEASAPHWERA